MSALDLKAIHDRACSLRNTAPGYEEDGETPHVRYLYEDYKDGRVWSSDVHHFPPPKESNYAGCMLLVGAGCEMLTIATNEGEQMPDVAEAIAKAGADLFALMDDRKATRAKHEAEIEKRQKECRMYRHTIRLLLEKNAALKGKAGGMNEVLQALNDGRDDLAVVLLVKHGATLEEGATPKGEAIPAEPAPASRPLDVEERERLACLTSEQNKNKLANHAMAADKLFELIDLRERAGIS